MVMQKIFAVRHMPRDGSGDLNHLGNFLRSELGDNQVEVYSSIEQVAFATALGLATEYLKDRFVAPRDDLLSGIGPYKVSHIGGRIPFPLFELTYCSASRISPDAINLFSGSNEGYVNINRKGLLTTHDAAWYYVRIRGYNKPELNDLRVITNIAAATANNILLVTHAGAIEQIQCLWGFPRRETALYLDGSIVIPSEGRCREFGMPAGKIKEVIKKQGSESVKESDDKGACDGNEPAF